MTDWKRHYDLRTEWYDTGAAAEDLSRMKWSAAADVESPYLVRKEIETEKSQLCRHALDTLLAGAVSRKEEGLLRREGSGQLFVKD